MVPEYIQFDEYYEEGACKTLTIGQKRICFTDLPSSELTGLAKAFGWFAIEYSHAAALEMGAMPVFYFPEVQKDAPGLSNLSGILICRLAETVALLKTLAELKDAVARSDPSQPMHITQAETGERLELDVQNTKRLVNHLDKNYRGFFTLSANVRALSQLFCPTHNSAYADPLAYYRQREWRIISDISAHNKPTWRMLTDDEKATVMQINSNFFGKIIEAFTGPRRRIDETRVYIHPTGKHALTFASAVIVPRDVIKETRDLLLAAELQVEVRAVESIL